MILVLSADGVIVEANRRSQDLLGTPPEAMVGRHVRTSRPSGDGEIRTSVRASRVDGQALALTVGRDVTEQIRSKTAFRPSSTTRASCSAR